MYLFVIEKCCKKRRQSESRHEDHSSTFRSSDKRLGNVYGIITRAFEYKESGSCHIFVVSLQFVLHVVIFFSLPLLSYYYLSYFLFLILPLCDIDTFFAKRFFSSQAIYHKYELLYAFTLLFSTNSGALLRFLFQPE
jgi:hypothetical protein